MGVDFGKAMLCLAKYDAGAPAFFGRYMGTAGGGIAPDSNSAAGVVRVDIQASE